MNAMMHNSMLQQQMYYQNLNVSNIQQTHSHNGTTLENGNGIEKNVDKNKNKENTNYNKFINNPYVQADNPYSFYPNQQTYFNQNFFQNQQSIKLNPEENEISK